MDILKSKGQSTFSIYRFFPLFLLFLLNLPYLPKALSQEVTPPVDPTTTPAPSVAEQHLVTITTDLSEDKYHVAFLVDAETGVIKEGLVNGTSILAQEFEDSLHQGLVLSKTHGINIVVLRSQDFELNQGGHVELRYLTNPITKSYRVKHFTLQRIQDQWTLLTKVKSDEAGSFSQELIASLEEFVGEIHGPGKFVIPVKSLHIITRKFFGIPVGIQKLIPSPTNL